MQFDRWFDRQPSLDRRAFCRQVGLPSDAPFVLFTGSSIFIARADVEIPRFATRTRNDVPGEPEFV